MYNYIHRHAINEKLITLYLKELSDIGYKEYKYYFTEETDNWEQQSIGQQYGYALKRFMSAIIAKRPKQEIIKYLHYAKDLGILTLQTGLFSSNEKEIVAKFQEGEFYVKGLKKTDKLVNFNVRVWQDTLYLAVILNDKDIISWLINFVPNEALIEADSDQIFPKIDYLVKDFLSNLYTLLYLKKEDENYKEIEKETWESYNLASNHAEKLLDNHIGTISNYAFAIKNWEMFIYISISSDDLNNYSRFQESLQTALENHYSFWNGDFGDDMYMADVGEDIGTRDWLSLPIIAGCIWNINNKKLNPKSEPLKVIPMSDYIPHWLIYQDFE